MQLANDFERAMEEAQRLERARVCGYWREADHRPALEELFTSTLPGLIGRCEDLVGTKMALLDDHNVSKAAERISRGNKDEAFIDYVAAYVLPALVDGIDNVLNEMFSPERLVCNEQGIVRPVNTLEYARLVAKRDDLEQVIDALEDVTPDSEKLEDLREEYYGLEDLVSELESACSVMDQKATVLPFMG